MAAGFNGAAIFRSRKVCPVGRAANRAAVLQWGRDLSIAESRSRAPAHAAPPCSFNGAAIFRSRKVDDAESSRAVWLSFNGAAIFRSRKGLTHVTQKRCNLMLQWGRDLSIAERDYLELRKKKVQKASMGPRSFDRGKNLEVGMGRNVRTGLQWGRDLSIAERQYWCRKALRQSIRFNGAAIFRSRKEDGHMAQSQFRSRAASMGPRSFDRGKYNSF